MATAKDFSRLDEIEGVSQYTLVHDDGHVVSGNSQNANELAAAIVISGRHCDTLADDLNGKRYIYCSIERTSGNNIMVFSLGRYYLGIIKHPDSDPQQLADAIIAFLKGLL